VQLRFVIENIDSGEYTACTQVKYSTFNISLGKKRSKSVMYNLKEMCFEVQALCEKQTKMYDVIY